MSEATVLIVPGLRDEVEAHWQTLLAIDLQARGRKVATVPPMGRLDLDCTTRVAAIERSRVPAPPISTTRSTPLPPVRARTPASQSGDSR